MNTEKYRNLVTNNISIERILTTAFLEEDGIIDYRLLLESIISSSNNIELLVSKFLSRPSVKHYQEYKNIFDSGKLFGEILAQLEIDNRFDYNERIGLMMKLFGISLEEFFVRSNEVKGFQTLSSSDRSEMANTALDRALNEDFDEV